MHVRFRGFAHGNYPPNEARYISPDQTFLSTAKEYEVHAVSVYDGVTFLQIVDDANTPTFHPRAIFEVVDSTIAEDWICSAFPEGPVQLVIGPSFVAKDLGCYDSMVDQDRSAVDAFWQRVNARQRHGAEFDDD